MAKKPTALIAFNKPFQVLPQFTDDANTPRMTLAAYINAPKYYPAGRLDYDSEGLMLLTNNGKLQAQVADPKHKLPKTYWVQVDGQINDGAVQQLSKGVILKDGFAEAVAVEKINEPTVWPRTPAVRYRAKIPTSWISMTLVEGRNRQVRRMTAKVGFPTLRLIRVSIGQLSVFSVEPGQWQYIDKSDLY
jgi:23S rRNA pseudouridine2457 synthase